MAGQRARSVGRPKVLTRARVAEAVLAAGFTDLRAADVAERLGVNPATLYRFVDGRHELVGLAISHLVRGEDWPERGDDWRAYLSDVTWRVWRMIAAHPGLATSAGTHAMTNPDLLRLYDHVVNQLIDAGFAPRTATVSVDMVLDLAVDSLKGRELIADDRTALRDLDVAEWSEHFSEQVRPIMVSVLTGDPAEWFGMKLAIALDGIAAAEGAPRDT